MRFCAKWKIVKNAAVLCLTCFGLCEPGQHGRLAQARPVLERVQPSSAGLKEGLMSLAGF